MAPQTQVPPEDYKSQIMQASRPNARMLINERIKRLHGEIDELEALSKALPLELPYAADEALFKLLCK